MPTIAHYEVYALENGGWVLHGRYTSAEKNQALDEARELDARIRRPTKVIRESYNTDTNRYTDQTVFRSPLARGERERARDREALGPVGGTAFHGTRPHTVIPPGLEEAFGTESADKPPRHSLLGKPKPVRTVRDLVARLMFVVIASLVIATSGTALIPVGISMLRNAGVYIDTILLSETLFAAFMVLVLGTGLLLTARLVPLEGFLEDSARARKRKADSARSAAVKKSMPERERKPEPSKRTPEPTPEPTDDSGEAAAPEEMSAKDAPTLQEYQRLKREEKEREKEEKKQKKAEKKKEGQEEEAPQQARSGEADGEAEAATDPDAQDQQAEPKAPVSPALSAGRDLLHSFLGKYVSALKTIRSHLDTYNRFGINLYLAGCCDVLGHRVGMSRSESQLLLRETAEIMGTRPALARSFVVQLDTYLTEERYAQMVQYGREAMTLMLNGGVEPFDNLGMVVEDWNTPRTQKVTGNTIAIVFTDIVGSTDMTSAVGDIKAQDILRAHNSAVRSALGRFSGREIKHTGDGIMATFEHVPDAVRGMADVLKAVRAHNQTHPDMPLRIRIGINAGEPISAENDYYGLAVTIAARVCAKADADQIMVSQVVRDMCADTDLRFADRGTETLKGIKGPQPIHEVLWGGSPSETEGAPDEATTEGATTEGGGEPEVEHGPREDEASGATAPLPEGSLDHEAPLPVDPEADGWVDEQLVHKTAPKTPRS
ncbi:adenylate/guanylate cyclase domain-containing protein [Rhodospira trueperi]|nr:adenylate/guanylate cyclase domain-containing protein [Rhodospira trueperi]